MNILLSDIVSSHVEQQQVNNLSLILLLLVAVALRVFHYLRACRLFVKVRSIAVNH